MIIINFNVLSDFKTCEHLCTGNWYKFLPCTRKSKVLMNGKILCALHIGIEIFQKLGVYRIMFLNEKQNGV